MKPNIELTRRLRTRFLRMRHDEHFDMEVIAVRTDCGSAMCIAGHTLDVAGYRMKPKTEPASSMLHFDFFSPSGRKVRNVLAAAARELGISYRPTRNNKAYDLFHDWELLTPKDAAERIGELIKEFS